MFVLDGISPIGDTHLGVNNSNVDSVYTALTHRLFYPKVNGVHALTPKPTQGGIDKLNKVVKLIGSKIGRLNPGTHQDVIDTYTGSRKTIYSKAAESLRVIPVCRADSYIKFFQKIEKIDTSKPPRGIMPRNPRYNIELATFLKLNEKRIIQGINNLYGYHVVAKGMNVVDMGCETLQYWNTFNHPCAIMLDATKFDAHVSKEILQCEHGLYKKCFGKNLLLNQLLSWQLNNHGVAYCHDGKITYNIEGTRCSGDINTSLGNIILMCSMVYQMLQEKHIKEHRVVNNGDDCYIIVEKHDKAKILDGIYDYFLQFGFNIRVDGVVTQLEDIRFCQMAPIRTTDGAVMVRDIKNIFAKDVMSSHDLTNTKVRRKWAYAVGYGGLAMYGNIPILRDFYSMYLESGLPSRFEYDPELRQSAWFWWGRGLKPYYSHVDDVTRISFYHAFGITPDTQMLMEESFNDKQALIRDPPLINEEDR
jgi:hypothetical protein